MARNYSPVYNKIVHDEADLIGHIAYSMYKDEKIRFIEDFKNKHSVDDLSEDDIRYFNDINSSDTSIKRYRDSASLILQSFLDNSVSDAIDAAEKDMNQNHLNALKEIINPITSFWKGVFQSIVGAFAFTLILCLLIFLLRFSDHQYTFTIGGNGNAAITENTITQDNNITDKNN